jgi:hypothetical protein
VTAVCSRVLGTIIFFVFCYVSVPYPYCYYYVEQIETETDVRLFFEKNDFFVECDKMNYRLVNTDKDIRVFLSGKEYKKLKNREVCK